MLFQYGRKETRDCSGHSGRDPDAQDGVPAIIQTFISSLGLDYIDAGIQAINSMIYTTRHYHLL